MDHKEKAKRMQNPAENANLLSKILWVWIIPLFRKGYKQDLGMDDLYDVMKKDSSKYLGDRVEEEWSKLVEKHKQKGPKPTLARALFAVFGKFYVGMGLLLCFDECIIRIAQPIFLRLYVRSFSDGSSFERQLGYAAGVCGAAILHIFGHHIPSFSIYHLGMKCRAAASALLYRKALRLSKSAQGQTTVGQLTNLLANDVNRFDINLLFFPYLIAGPLQLAIFIYILWEEVSIASLGGIGFVVLLMPVQYWIGKYSAMFRRKVAERTDERVRSMGEIVMAMRVIKMYAWEKPFATLINTLRRHEVKVLRKRAYLRAAYQSMFNSSGKLVLFLTVLIFVLSGNALSADKVFFAASIFVIMMQNMVYVIPSAAAGLGEIFVALTRVETFLQLEEQSTASEHLELRPRAKHSRDAEEVSANLHSVTACWIPEKPTLKKLNIELVGNKLVMVVGPVGSGKSSFLNLLLAEIPITEGKCTIYGSTSYASQEPWIFSGNIRDNVLFGKEFDEERYNEILRVCALKDDLKLLPYGDMSEVGDRGNSLSGGQKARVNLARCLYQDADIYLLDDPLSAVDSRVSRHIFERCVKQHLQGHLRILVTHQLQYLPSADHIIVLNEGDVLAQGTYEELMEQNIDFVSLIAGEEVDEPNRKASVISLIKNTVEDKPQQGPEAKEEQMSAGSVTLATYRKYFQSGRSCVSIFLIIFGFLFAQLVVTLCDVWLSYWTNHSKHMQANVVSALNETIEAEIMALNLADQHFYLIVYSILVCGVIIVITGTSFIFFRYCMQVGISLHDSMFSSLVRAPTAFFDTNPSGRIMNRFTKDIGSMDELLPPAFYDMITIFLQMFGLVIVVVIANYYVVVPTVVVVGILFFIRVVYISTVRDIKRWESINKSPVFSHMCTSFQGLSIIRSSNSQDIVAKKFDELQDLHTSTWYLFIGTTRAFGVWLELVCGAYLTIVCFSFLFLSTSTLSGNIGLAINAALGLNGMFQYGMRQSAETENLMISVERILEYVGIKSEAPLESRDDKKPPPTWPVKGAIKFQNVSLAYDEKDVLKDLTFDINEREKIGIVGRTGAGKSTVISALFRMTEPRGDIYIDGVKINDIGLHDLRKSISIIPQDPVLFSGSVRYNLDPFNQFKDEELWKVLEEVELKEAVPSLDFIVADGGSNFSVGQRQLVCLARAILRRNFIVILDEATANVDPRTDNFIQQTIRTKFSECSIITIAHRLHSVMDCDRILVLDQGRLKEYDHPHALLQNPDGILTAMVKHTGKASTQYLHRIAEESFSGMKQYNTRL